MTTPQSTAQFYKLTKLEKFVWDNRDARWNDLASQTNRTFNTIANAYKRASLKIAARVGVPMVTPAPVAAKVTPAAPVAPVAPAFNHKEYEATFAACVAGGMSTQAAHDYATERANVKLPPVPAPPAPAFSKAIDGGRVIIPQGYFLIPKSAQIFPGDYFTTPARDVWQLTANTSPANQNPFVSRAYIRKIA